MSKRRHGDKAKAEGQAGGSGSVGVSAGGTVIRSLDSGKSLVQLQAERIAEGLYTDMMAAGGVPHSRIALEVLYYLPRTFLDAYAEIFRLALAGDDGGAGAKGEANRRTAELGRAARKTTGGAGKKYKKYWTVRDDFMLDFKEKIDKRLRGMAREMQQTIDEAALRGGTRAMEQAGRLLESSEALGGGGGRASVAPTCHGCGGFTSQGWRYCARCGCDLNAKSDRMEKGPIAGQS